jgi:hypothetical protein
MAFISFITKRMSEPQPCARCGKGFVLKSPNERYCDDCKAAHKREWDVNYNRTGRKKRA